MTQPMLNDDQDQGDEVTQLRAVQAEVAAEEDDGTVTVTLVTDLGEADIRVPPVERWRSSAKAALFSRGDDFTWAQATLSREDAKAWASLDPTTTESNDFFTRWSETAGQNLAASRGANRSSRRMQRR